MSAAWLEVERAGNDDAEAITFRPLFPGCYVNNSAPPTARRAPVSKGIQPGRSRICNDSGSAEGGVVIGFAGHLVDQLGVDDLSVGVDHDHRPSEYAGERTVDHGEAVIGPER